MAFSGDLRTVELAEILQWIAQNQRTGTLHLARDQVEKKIAFQNGLIASTHSTDPRDQLGQFLVREGFVTEQDLFTALLRQESEGKMLGALLVESGRLTSDQLQRVLRLKAEETVYDLFHWQGGRFEFKEGEVPRNLPLLLGLDVTAMIFEGARRLDEMSRIRAVIPSTRATFTAKGVLGEGSLESQILGLAARGKTVAAIALEVRRSEFDVASRLYDLVEQGVLSVNAGGAESGQGSTVGAIRTLLERAMRAIRDRRFHDAAAAYDSVLLLDPLNQNAKKGLLDLERKASRPAPQQEQALLEVPRLARDLTALSEEQLEPLEGFMLSRINGMWNVRSILKLCPVPEEEAWRVFESLLARGLVTLGASSSTPTKLQQ
jgi:hypothetical protein